VLLATSAWGGAGDKLWETEFNLPIYSNLTITALSASQTSVIICGYASGAASTPMQIGFVKAFDVTTGSLKWEHDLMLGSQTNSYTAISTDGGIALVMGTAYGMNNNTPNPLSKAIIRACDADTGQFLWETQKDIYQMAAPMATSSTYPFMATSNNRTYLAVIAPKVGMPGMAGNCIVYAFQTKNVFTTNLLLME
jgi:outer membrane protein assembly factor BamB